MTNDLDVKYELVSDYKIFEDHILVMQPIAGVTYNLYIIDVGRKIHSPAFFPALLRIRDVKFFEYAFGNYYIVLVHKDLITCLWITTATPFHFVRKACYSAPTNSLIESNIHIDKRVEGQIYFNLPSNANSLKTHISTDDGRYWDLVKLEIKPFKISKPPQFNFTLYDPQSVPKHFGFMDFQYEKLKDGLQPFMTINGGHTWNPTPKSTSRVLMLNYETAILSISRDLSAINYSLDKGATWLSHKLFPENSAFHHLERLFDTNLNVLIVTGTPQDHLLRFDIVDFSNFFNLNSENDAPVKFNFEFHDPHSVPIHFGFIDIQYKKLKDGLQPFLTTDGGHSWNPMPITAIRPILLNYETVILSINRDLSAINYSYDKGTTWLTHKLFTKSHSLYHFGRLSDTDLKVLIVTRGSEDDELRFSILDFSNIFNSECKTNDFRQYPLIGCHELCFRGIKLDIITRDPEIRCLNKLHKRTKVEYLCPCSSEDFGCSFNFHPKDDVCVVDPLSRIAEEPFKCEKGTHLDITQLG
ncbi:Vacuolar protein sorting/targeting protein VPS10 2 [Thelohanellus kitauei]|uniref:Vacuolar protein sorting/targeting protein VPS10 2 n=1 Tax=Thelohanellus kitauei TaxID=669202 RepID=A0A0C2ICL9_THEKT|nr:Vacuolar protein sorting/targeting protein VPS10 2 [Thelohanellus kitauei]